MAADNRKLSEMEKEAIQDFIAAAKRANQAHLAAIKAQRDREDAAKALVDALGFVHMPELILMDGDVIHINRALLEVEDGYSTYGRAIRLISDIARVDP